MVPYYSARALARESCTCDSTRTFHFAALFKYMRIFVHNLVFFLPRFTWSDRFPVKTILIENAYRPIDENLKL